MALTRTASLRTNGVDTSVTTAVAAKTPRYAVIGSVRVRGEALHEVPDAAARLLAHALVRRRLQHVADDVADLLQLRLVHAERRRAGRSHPDTRAGARRQRIERDRVLVQRDAGLLAERLGLGARHADGLQV